MNVRKLFINESLLHCRHSKERLFDAICTTRDAMNRLRFIYLIKSTTMGMLVPPLSSQ